MGDVDVAMLSRLRPLKSPGEVATDAGAATLRAERLKILRRRGVSASMAGFDMSSSLLLTAETLHVEGCPQN
jgi:hypothetical protein